MSSRLHRSGGVKPSPPALALLMVPDKDQYLALHFSQFILMISCRGLEDLVLAVILVTSSLEQLGLLMILS